MKIYFVRHAKAIKRADWAGRDALRPLTTKGEDQARGLQAILASGPIRRICSSPAVRCHETVERLAADRSLLVELDDRLGEESNVAAAMKVLEEQSQAPILICAGRTLLLEILSALGIGADDPASVRCQKGGVWIVELRAGRIAEAEYFTPRAIAVTQPGTPRRAVLDIGSASMSTLVADVRAEDRIVEPILRTRTGLRFGATLGAIDKLECERVAELAQEMKAEAEAVGSTQFLPVATAGLRDASNGKAIADRIGQALGMPVRLLSGEEEASFVYRAVRARLGVGDIPMLVFDLGGGSLDLACGTGADIHYEASAPLGVTRVRAEFGCSDPMPDDVFEQIRKRVIAGLEPHLEAVTRKDPQCFAAGGTVRALARLVQARRGRADFESVRDLRISRVELTALTAGLRRSSHEERMKMPTVRARRVDLLPTGAVILSTLLDELDADTLRVSDWGLREGVLLG